MSRLRNLKERKRKSIMKATSYGLALTLVLGSVQGLGTYALFNDNETVSGNISLSTGDVDVKVNGGQHLKDIKPGGTRELVVEITNEGTLNQNVKLELDISDSIKKYINYNFDFKGFNVGKDGVMYNKDGELLVLAPGSRIEGVINITVNQMDENKQNELAGKEQEIKLTVTSRQINRDKTFSTNGFYDEFTQVNTITIDKAQTIEDDNILYSGKDGVLKLNPENILVENAIIMVEYYSPENEEYNGLLDIIEKLDGNLKVDPNKISIINKVGAFENSNFRIITNENYNPKGIEINSIDGTLIKEDFVNKNYIDIKIDYEENSISKLYRIDFRAELVKVPVEGEEKPKEKSLAEAKVTLIDTKVTQEDESLNEEIEVPNKPEVIEPQKEEEIEIPNKPEVIEPPKENEELQ